ncbi:MAG: hypothetical protein R3E32_29580 [Chitinophagales bacterium]
MSLFIYRLMFDFGLLVLIWIVQLVIYPSFRHYSKKNLIGWHIRYTTQFTYIVLPLMLGQLIISIFQFKVIDSQPMAQYVELSLLLIISLWISTFLQFVPIHNKIANGNFDDELLLRLIKKNWIRTILWTFLFCFSLIYGVYHFPH